MTGSLCCAWWCRYYLHQRRQYALRQRHYMRRRRLCGQSG